MLDGNQLVTIKWNASNKKWYEELGYKYTKIHDKFDVNASHLTRGSDASVIAICDYCGGEYETKYCIVASVKDKTEKDCCKFCASKKSAEKSLKRRMSKYYSKALDVCERFGYELISTEYDMDNVKNYIKFNCKKHGEQSMMLDNFIRGHQCKKCSYELRANGLRTDTSLIEKRINSINGNVLLNIDEFKDVTKHNLRIRCSCGKEFTTSFVNYTKHNVTTCFSCSSKESSGEKLIKSILDELQIEYIQEKRFDDCRDIKPLPFDFYLPGYNTVIEFDGQFHFDGRNYNNHETTVKHDTIKDNYCSVKGIAVIRIPYWESQNARDIIAEELNIYVEDIV